MNRLSAPAAPLLVLGLAGSLLSQSPYDITIIHVNTPGHPANVVPGTGGLAFNAGSSTTSAFYRPVSDLTGLQIAIHAVAETAATTDDEVLLLNGGLVLREGSPAPWSASDTVGFIDEDWGGVNALGDLIYAGDVQPATTLDEVVAVRLGGVWTQLVQEGGTNVATFAPGIIGLQPGSAWGSSMSAARITTTGDVVWLATGLQNLTTGTSHDDVIVNTAGPELQKSDKGQIPLGQAGSFLYTWENFDANDVYVSPSGAQVLVQGDLWGPSDPDDVMVLNGTVVLQENSVIPGSSFAEPIDLSGLLKGWVDVAGNWYARGNNDLTETDWVVRNGTVVAQSDGSQPLFPGAGENWDDTNYTNGFFAFDGNNLGQYMIGGVTNTGLGVDFDAVLVFYDGSGAGVVAAREGDPVDLDGNGLFDDDRFLDTFGDDDALLLDDGSIVFVANMRTSLGTNIDNGLFRLVPPSASCTFRNGSGTNPVALTCTTLPIVGTNFQVDVSFGPNTVGAAAYLSFGSLPGIPIPFPMGELLIDPAAYPFPASLPVLHSYLGIEVYLQGLRLENTGDVLLTNAQDVVFGY